MQRIDFAKRIPFTSEKNSPPEIFDREETAELSILKPIEEQDLTFELSLCTSSDTVIERLDNNLDTVSNLQIIDEDPIKHNECRCFGKTLRFTGSTVAVIGAFSWFFGGATLGTIIIVFGLSMLLIGIIMKIYARRV